MPLSSITSNPWTTSNAVRAKSETIKTDSSFFRRIFAPLLEQKNRILDSSCMSRLSGKYPNMDANSRAIVQILCDNKQTAVSTSGIFDCSNDGVSAMGEALEQNTALQSFDLGTVECVDPDRDCLSTLVNAFSSALTINRSLKELSLSFSGDASSIATQTLLHSLPCYNLVSLSFYLPTITTDGAADFAQTIQNHPYFPLKDLTWAGISNTAASVPEVMVALGNSQCIANVDMSEGSLTAAEYVDLFQNAIGNSKINSVSLPITPGIPTPIPFTANQEQAILSGIANNSCFRNYTLPYTGAFSSSLTASIQNLTQGRAACAPNPQCLIPATCATPPTPIPTPIPTLIPIAPSSGEGYSTTVLAIAVGVSVVATFALTCVVNALYRRCKPERPLIPLSEQRA